MNRELDDSKDGNLKNENVKRNIKRRDFIAGLSILPIVASSRSKTGRVNSPSMLLTTKSNKRSDTIRMI